MANRVCIDCGRALVDQVRGRPALRCGECSRGRRRIKERATVVCKECQTEFKPPGQTGKLPERCAACREARRREASRKRTEQWREANPDRARAAGRRYYDKWRRDNPEWREIKNAREVKRKYGLTPAEFDALLDQQGGVCAICGGGPNGPGSRLHIDHCHNSNKVRGLLCGKCNTAVGLLDDDPYRAEKLAAYLRR